MKFGFNFGLKSIKKKIKKALILYTDTLNNFIYKTNDSNNVVIDNRGSSKSTNDLLLNAGRAVELGATNDVDIPTFVDGSIMHFDIDTAEFVQEATDGTDKTFNDKTINNIMPTHTAFNASDLAKLNSNHNLLAKLAKSETGSIEELDMVLVGDEAWYACSEGSGATLHDARGSGTATISNYAETVRTNADQQTVGLQTTCLTLDALGVPTAYREDALEWHGDGYGDTQWIPNGTLEIDIAFFFPEENDCEVGDMTVVGIADTPDWFCIAYIGSSRAVKFTVGGTSVYKAKILEYGTWNFVTATYNSSTKISNILVSNIDQNINSSVSTVSLSKSLYIGNINGYLNRKLKTPTGYFQYVNRVRTSAERDADYAKAKLQHPTLP